VLDDNHSPTSTTWGAAANQELDQRALPPSLYGRNAQPEAFPPPQRGVILNQTVPMRSLAAGHGGVGSNAAAWEMDELRYPGDIEAGYHDPEMYKMESQPYLGEEKAGTLTVKLGVPKRPHRPGTSALNPLVSTFRHILWRLRLIGFPQILSYTSPLDMIDGYAAAPRRRPSPTHF
jgi:hypothetical protein